VLFRSAGLEVIEMKGTSFTRLLGGVDRAGLKKIKEVILKRLKWFAWIKNLVLRLKSLSGRHDCVLAAARRPLARELSKDV
jgi:hypothetical protein